MKSEYVLGKIRHSKEVIKLISHLRRYDQSEVAKERQKIIAFMKLTGKEQPRKLSELIGNLSISGAKGLRPGVV